MTSNQHEVSFFLAKCVLRYFGNMTKYRTEFECFMTVPFAGIPRLITADMVREGTAVIDVGINYVQDPTTGKTKLVGDVDFEGKNPNLLICEGDTSISIFILVMRAVLTVSLVENNICKTLPPSPHHHSLPLNALPS